MTDLINGHLPGIALFTVVVFPRTLRNAAVRDNVLALLERLRSIFRVSSPDIAADERCLTVHPHAIFQETRRVCDCEIGDGRTVLCESQFRITGDVTNYCGINSVRHSGKPF